MRFSNVVMAALSAFLMVFFAHMLLLAPNPIAQAWGVVAVIVCASAMVYFTRCE